jgi:mannose/fructose/N-acetylgalactosamine-specific phosphotransferase system component IIC
VNVIAHGGVAGALAESLIALAVVGVFVAIVIRERAARKHDAEDPGLSEPDE